MAQVTHNNHFVPQSYLRRWSDDGYRVHCYQLLVPNDNFPKWGLRPVRGIAYQRDLYTISVGKEETDEHEKWLEKEFETPAQDAIERVIQGRVLTSFDRERLALYMAAQDLRTPLSYIETTARWRQQFPNLLQQTLNKTVKELEKSKRTGRTPKKRKQEKKPPFADSFRIQINKDARPETKQAEIRVAVTVGRRLWIESQKYLLENTAQKLLSHSWSIVEPAYGMEWITSDHPVVRVNYYGPGRYDFKGGWGKKNGNLIMPLSPKHLLFTQIGDKQPGWMMFSEEATLEIQRFIAERAHRFIFARKPLNNIEQFRSRFVDQDAYNDEQRIWANWHSDQSKSEQS